MAIDETEPRSDPDAGWLTTQKRLILAIVILIVVAGGLTWLDNAIKTRSTSTAAYPNVTKVDIKNNNGTVKLVSTSGPVVQVERKIVYAFRSPSLKQQVVGDTLQIRQNCSGLRVGECHADYVIALPGSVTSVVTSKGREVTIDGTQGKVTATTDGGEITVKQAFGDLDLTTAGGEIKTDDLSAQRVKAQTKGGKITLQFATAPLGTDAKSNDGAVVVAIPKTDVAYKVDASSMNGRSTIDVTNDANAPRSITARSENGDVTVERK